MSEDFEKWSNQLSSDLEAMSKAISDAISGMGQDIQSSADGISALLQQFGIKMDDIGLSISNLQLNNSASTVAGQGGHVGALDSNTGNTTTTKEEKTGDSQVIVKDVTNSSNYIHLWDKNGNGSTDDGTGTKSYTDRNGNTFNLVGTPGSTDVLKAAYISNGAARAYAVYQNESGECYVNANGTKQWLNLRTKHYAKGSKHINGNILGITNEDGREIVITKNHGIIIPLQSGDGVIPNNLTENLMDMAKEYQQNGYSLNGMNDYKEFDGMRAIQKSQIVNNNRGGDVHLSIDNSVKVQGDVTKDTLPDLQTIMKKSSEYTQHEIAKNMRRFR